MDEQQASEVLDELCQDLWRRWEAQFDNVSDLLRFSSLGVRVVYSAHINYSLDDYTISTFPARGKVSREPIEGVCNWIYRLDPFDRPIHVSYNPNSRESNLDSAQENLRSGVDVLEKKADDSWQGMYWYGDGEAHFVLFLLPLGIPCVYRRIVLNGNCVISAQSLGINSLGRFGIVLSRENYVEFIRGSDLDADYLAALNRTIESHGLPLPPVTSMQVGSKYSAGVEEYVIDNGRQVEGFVLTEMSGSAPAYGTYSFQYSSDGTLERKVLHRPGEPDVIVYARPSNLSTQKLAASLTERIANGTMDAIRKGSVDGAIVSVELNYRVGHYLPGIAVRTRPYTTEDPITPEVPPDDYILSQDDLEPEISDFRDRMQTSGRPAIGQKMLREAAKLVVERMRLEFETVDQFFAFAIDWEIEGDDLPKVLKACGVNPEWIKAWKKSRYL